MIESILMMIVPLSAFIAGFILGKSNYCKPSKTESTAMVEADSELIHARQREVAEQMQKQENAFRQMLNYNPGVAYGVATLEKEVDT
jgi:uncharacterized membrane protein